MDRERLANVKVALAAGLVIFLGSGTILDHHSFAAAYNMEQPIEITERIVNICLTNPHSYFFLNLEDNNGEIERWSFEAGTPRCMVTDGYSP